jgi:hypothetical protein
MARPKAEANKLSTILRAAFGEDRFPVPVKDVALGYGAQFSCPDAITEIRAANIPRFEGALIPKAERRSWGILYNETITSAGRIRFTLAHELGHYIMHRRERDRFECTEDDLLGGTAEEGVMEAEADTFASYLLMPIDDYRRQIRSASVNLEILGHCAQRYGVSLTAAIRKWLEFTEQPAVFVMSVDGFMSWSVSSETAFKRGYFFATRKKTIEVPQGSLTIDDSMPVERKGREVPGNVWFPQLMHDESVIEMKIRADNYDQTLTLLMLPSGMPRCSADEESEPDSFDRFSSYGR